jgi:hypothetical protein
MNQPRPAPAYVPKSQQTATWRIFHKKYRCRVPVFHTRSIEDIEHFGTPASGDAEFDKTMLNEVRIYYKTTDEMIELYKRNVPLMLMDPKDAKTIYEDISEHLQLWRTTHEYSVNLKPDNDLLEDLMTMDRFATLVYPHAHPFFKTVSVESSLARGISELFQLPILAAADTPKPAKVERKEYVAPERESFEEIFANRREVSARSWRG